MSVLVLVLVLVLMLVLMLMVCKMVAWLEWLLPPSLSAMQIGTFVQCSSWQLIQQVLGLAAQKVCTACCCQCQRQWQQSQYCGWLNGCARQ